LLALLVATGCGYDPQRIGLADDAMPGGDGALIDSGDDSGVDAPPFACPAGYLLRVPGSCHRAVLTPTTWDLAEADCELAGAHLAVIDDATEDASLPDNVWIGITERVTAGTFLWVTGVPVGYVGWATGEPGSLGGASCAEARPDGWHDDNCPEAKAYVCEFDGTAANPATY
jgi:hypothetical protein